MITVGVGTVKFSGLIQAWYMGGMPDVTNTVRLRRAEVRFVGDISPSTRWTLMVDPSKTISVNNTYVTIGETQVFERGGPACPRAPAPTPRKAAPKKIRVTASPEPE